MERKTKVAGETNSLKVGIVCDFYNILIRQRRPDIIRQFFSPCQIDDLYLSSINRIAEEEDFKVLRLGIFVNTALPQVY